MWFVFCYHTEEDCCLFSSVCLLLSLSLSVCLSVWFIMQKLIKLCKVVDMVKGSVGWISSVWRLHDYLAIGLYSCTIRHQRISCWLDCCGHVAGKALWCDCRWYGGASIYISSIQESRQKHGHCQGRFVLLWQIFCLWLLLLAFANTF